MVRRAGRPAAACALAVALCAIDAPLAAQPASLAKAQAALDDLRYEDAAELAERTWRAGGNRRDDLVAIFQLAGQVAVTLGHGEQAEGYFIRLLTLDPEAQLPEGSSPKIAARFAAAKGKTPGRLRAAFRVEGMTVSADVQSDPVKMVSSLRVRYNRDKGKQGVQEAVEEAIAPDPLRVTLANLERPYVIELELLDEFGNILVEDKATLEPARAGPARTQAQVGQSLAERNAAGAAAGPARLETAEQEAAEDDGPRPIGPPVYTRGEVWTGAAGALGAVGIVFGLKARSDQGKLDDLNDESGDHDFRDAQATEDALRRDALIANVSFVLAAGAGTAALLLWLRERRSRPRTTSIAPSGAGAVVRFDF